METCKALNLQDYKCKNSNVVRMQCVMLVDPTYLSKHIMLLSCSCAHPHHYMHEHTSRKAPGQAAPAGQSAARPGPAWGSSELGKKRPGLGHHRACYSRPMPSASPACVQEVASRPAAQEFGFFSGPGELPLAQCLATARRKREVLLRKPIAKKRREFPLPRKRKWDIRTPS